MSSVPVESLKKVPQHSELANAIRALAMDAVEKAKSGHPGMPMGMADIATVLWRKHLKHNPLNPQWMNRDRFVLSNGHGSMLLYAVLHLSGYDLSIEDIKNFRQLHSKTPGHPEYGITPGVETTTGPLGQGLANAVGMALAERLLRDAFNQSNHKIIDHHTYVFVGDGCLMEGISHEACSLAGTLRLNKLIVFYDENSISIDGDVQGWYTENPTLRFESYGWQVIGPIDGHDEHAIDQAIIEAKKSDRPVMIRCRTVIGYGAPHKAGTADTHGTPLGAEEISGTREKLHWPYAPFEIPPDITHEWNQRERGKQLEAEWQNDWKKYQTAHGELSQELLRRVQHELPQDWKSFVEQTKQDLVTQTKSIATRKASHICLEKLSQKLPELVGGSADLAGSNLTLTKYSTDITSTNSGSAIYFGVREFAMCAIVNGLALYGGFKPFGATFLVFSDYARNAIRVAALMKAPSIFVFTHDSIGLGEDGPTHQPVEHLASLRLMPNLAVWRPCDLAESWVAWKAAVSSLQTPHVLVFSRQNTNQQPRSTEQLNAIERGGYILLAEQSELKLVIIATGSEIDLAVKVAGDINGARVVSMPCTLIFDQQDQVYKDSVLPPHIPRLAVEAGSKDYWWKYVGLDGDVIGMDSFGDSAPANQLFEYFGFTAEHVTEKAKQLIAKK